MHFENQGEELIALDFISTDEQSRLNNNAQFQASLYNFDIGSDVEATKKHQRSNRGEKRRR